MGLPTLSPQAILASSLAKLRGTLYLSPSACNAMEEEDKMLIKLEEGECKGMVSVRSCDVSTPLQPAKRSRCRSTPHRQELAARVFEALLPEDRDTLGHVEMRHFASFIGFDGDVNVWVKEYVALSLHNDWSTKRGIGFEQFLNFVNNERGSGFCTDEELETIAVELTCLKQILTQEGIDRDRDTKDSQNEDCMTGVEEGSDSSRSQEEEPSDEDEASGNGADHGSEDEQEVDSDVTSQDESDSETDSLASSNEAPQLTNLLDVSPPVGTLVEVYYDDNTWSRGVVTDSNGTTARISWVSEGDQEELQEDTDLDFSEDCVRLASDQASERTLS
eukprot:TRINITY_DN12840_c0_g1_i2.p1 TRINITY_DN12840_c0_g1~~TRINITY_DN12840_c0_g1_i2.p1  ORF type:complete len:333 (-),score=75.51 TRINITY_DN12840_c0_g1_i2:55-1053(-)